MQLLVLDPSRATEIFSVPKRRFFALLKVVRYRNKSGLQFVSLGEGFSEHCGLSPLRGRSAGAISGLQPSSLRGER